MDKENINLDNQEEDIKNNKNIWDIIRVIALILSIIALIIAILNYIDIKKYSNELKNRDKYNNAIIITMPNITKNSKSNDSNIEFKKLELSESYTIKCSIITPNNDYSCENQFIPNNKFELLRINKE